MDFYEIPYRSSSHKAVEQFILRFVKIGKVKGIKVKVKFAVEQTVKAQRRSRGIAQLFL